VELANLANHEGNYETGNQAFSMHLRFLTIRGLSRYFGIRFAMFRMASNISSRFLISTFGGGSASRKTTTFSPSQTADGKMMASIPFSAR
jgi:hypothetical protein